MYILYTRHGLRKSKEDINYLFDFCCEVFSILQNGPLEQLHQQVTMCAGTGWKMDVLSLKRDYVPVGIYIRNRSDPMFHRLQFKFRFLRTIDF